MNWKPFSILHNGRVITGVYNPDVGTITEIKNWLQLTGRKNEQTN